MTGKTDQDWIDIDYDPKSCTLSLTYDLDSDDAFNAAMNIAGTLNRVWSGLTVNGDVFWK